jgi:hypothetical protein
LQSNRDFAFSEPLKACFHKDMEMQKTEATKGSKGFLIDASLTGRS